MRTSSFLGDDSVMSNRDTEVLCRDTRVVGIS